MSHPFDGEWIADLEASQRHVNHQFQSATLHFVVTGTTVTLTQSGVNASGRHESSTLTLSVDDDEHPASPQAPDVVVVTRWLGTHVLETVAKRGGDILGRATYEVAPNGTTLTARVAGIDAQGAAFEHVIVFRTAGSSPAVSGVDRLMAGPYS